MQSASNPNPTIVIVGAGPTGLSLAAELRRLGVASTLIDQSEAGANTSRAAVVHARTLEVLQPLGVTPQLLQRGVRVPVFRVRDRDRELLTMEFGGLDTAYPFTLMCPQNETESVLLERLVQLGGEVRRPVELRELQLQDGGVVAHLRGREGALAIEADWVVGCDGMHSRVRAQAGIEFDGGDYHQSFVLADVHMDWPLSREEVTLFFSPQGLVVVAPLPHDRFRIVATVDEAPPEPSGAFMQGVLDARGPTHDSGHVRDVVWSSRFHVHHRVAATQRRGRALLCGDAAHVHSPAGGQGMNTGIQDGVSLARALGKTLADGSESHIDAWAEARHQVAHEVVQVTDRMTRAATTTSWAGRALRNTVLGAFDHVPAVRHAVAKKLAELDLRD